MDIEKFKLNTPETIHSENKLETFEKIKNPEELLGFMKDNITYGFVGKNNKKVYDHNEIMDADFEKEYYLQSPEELLDSKHGVCWDSVELERHWFSKHDYDYKTYFMMFAKEEKTDLPTHTFLVYKQDDKWFWFEHSFGSNRGIHEYNTSEELFDDVKKKQHEYAMKSRGAIKEDSKYLKFSEYEKPNYGATPEEFVSGIFEKK